MAPIFDSDVAEDRWEKASWRNFQLWETIEQNILKKKRYWVIATGVVFILLSSVPLFMDRWSKWASLSMSRRLATEINAVKLQSSLSGQILRLRFTDRTKFEFLVESVSNCEATQGKTLRTGTVGTVGQGENLMLLSPAEGEALEIPGLLENYCYDPFVERGPLPEGAILRGFAILPKEDWGDKRLDRLSLVLLKGPYSEISFE